MVYRLGWMLVHSLWEGAAIAAVLALVLLFVPRRAAKVRYLGNLLAMVAMIAAFAVTLAISPRPAEPLPVVVPTAPISLDVQHVEPVGARVPMSMDVAPATPVPRASAAEKINHWIDAISLPVARFWFAGVMLLGIWRMAAWFSVQRLRVVKTEPADSAILATAKRLADRLNLSKAFEILISNFTETPMVIGWLRPVILIPASALTGLSQTQLEAILAHELAHILRHDYLVNLLQIVAETLLFYHPAVWWISRQIRLEREQACDDVAVSLCADRQEYARSLAAIEEMRLAGSMAMAARGSGGRQMVARVRRILGATDDAPRWGLPMVVGLVVIATAAVGLYSQSKTNHGSTTQPFTLQNDAPQLSPFTSVRWRADIAEVQYKDTWYELVSINDIPVPKIMDYLTTSNDFAPQKHFAEDLVEVMRDMNSEPGKTVKLELKTLDTKQAVTIPDAAMTEENRRSVLLAGNVERPPGTSRPDQSGDTSAPFPKVNTAPGTPQPLRPDADGMGSSVPITQSIFLSRQVADLIEIETAKLEFDDAWSDFQNKKAHGETPAHVQELVEEDPDIIRSKEQVDVIRNRMNDIQSDRGSQNPQWIGLQKSLETTQKRLDDLRTEKTAATMGSYEADLKKTREGIAANIAYTRAKIAQFQAETGLVKNPGAGTTSTPAQDIFKFDIPFQKGAMQFLDGDQITVTSVKGTAADMQSGICCISGTYTLASHDHATLAASVTAAESKDGVGPWNDAQTMTVQKGTGTFKLLLPVSIKGWPHVSFYDGSAFSGVYIGTGDWVLRKWWGSRITDTTNPAAGQ